MHSLVNQILDHSLAFYLINQLWFKLFVYKIALFLYLLSWYYCNAYLEELLVLKRYSNFLGHILNDLISTDLIYFNDVVIYSYRCYIFIFSRSQAENNHKNLLLKLFALKEKLVHTTILYTVYTIQYILVVSK